MDRVRLDKWLWAARFFKTRSLAARACEFGKVECNGQRAKPGRELRVGDRLQVKTEGGDFQVTVLLLSDIRGPAAVAQTLYQESAESRDLRQRQAEERKLARLSSVLAEDGRPSKRDRRKLDHLRGRY